MCGLVGIAGDLQFKDEITLKRMLLLDYFRGPDSTGLAAIRTNGEVKISKVPSHPLDLFDMGKFKDALSGYNSSVFIGHNRAATRGVINHANAHPFQFDHITGAHNGTLDHSCFSDLEKELGETFSVDSQAIIAAIARMGLQTTISGLSGSWSIVYYNSLDDTLNFIRNKERPMWYAYAKDFKKLFWASEYPMIEGATDMTGGYDLFCEEKTYHRFWQTDENIHYSFDIGALRTGGVRPKPKAKEIKGKETRAVVASGGSNDPFLRKHGVNTDITMSTVNGVTHIHRGTDSNSTTPSKTSSKSKQQVVHLIGDADRPLAGYINMEEFFSIAKHGCTFCKTPVNWGDQGVTIFERDGTILCPFCSDTQGQSRIYMKNDLYL